MKNIGIFRNIKQTKCGISTTKKLWEKFPEMKNIGISRNIKQTKWFKIFYCKLWSIHLMRWVYIKDLFYMTHSMYKYDIVWENIHLSPPEHGGQ